MGQYDGWKQQQLQAEASSRGLSAAGSNAELTERLEQHDAMVGNEPDLLGDDTPPVPAAPQPVAVSVAAAPQIQYVMQVPPPAPPEPPAKEKTFRVEYEVRGELSTAIHLDNRERAYQAAIDAGKLPRGGLAGVCRVGWRKVPGGTKLAIYEVLLQR